MSGGHFDYGQFRILEIVEEIKYLIEVNDKEEEGYGFSEETIREFKIAINKLKEANVYAHRIDWLVSGDDGEETFHERLSEELSRLKKEELI